MKNRQETKAQHFLPQCYLEGFAGEDGKLATLNLDAFVKFGKRPYPKRFTPAQICYDNDFYTVQNQENVFLTGDVEDKWVIEKSFHEYENKFKNLIKKITDQNELSVEDASLLVRIILDFKFRNKYFRDKLITPNQSKVIIEASDEILDSLINDPDYLRKFEGASLEDMRAINDAVRSKLSADKNFGKNAHISALLNKSDAYDEMIASYVPKILNYRWLIFISDAEFISNDNPGFSMDSDNKIHNSLFQGDFLFFFPLNASLLLTFTDAAKDQEFIKDPHKKNCPKLPVSKEFTDISNANCLRHYNKIVFGPKEDQMSELAGKLKLTKP